MNLKNFFQPAAIAVVGASRDKSKIGRQILDNLISGGFSGSIYPINLKDKTIASLPAYSSLEAISNRERRQLLVVIAIPAAFVLSEIEKCGRLGIKDIIIISAGFGEIGGEGKKREAELQSLAKQYNLNILGPNCLGFISWLTNLNASFSGRLSVASKKSSTTKKSAGRIALLSQSGAVGSAALDWLKVRNLELACFISLGNKTVLDENDFIEYLSTRKDIDAIVMYLEDIRSGRRFLDLVSKISKHKAIIVLKAGASERGSELARSHTGALTGSKDAVRAGLARAGAVMIDNLEDLFGLLIMLQSPAACQSIPSKLKVLTNAGGLAVLSADEAERRNLEVSTSLDILGDADSGRYTEALKKIIAGGGQEPILVLLTPQAATDSLETAKVVVMIAKREPKRLIVASFLGGQAVAEAKQILSSANLPSFDHPEQAIAAISYLAKRSRLLKTLTPYRINPSAFQKKKPALMSSDYLKSLALISNYKIPTSKTIKYDPGKTKLANSIFPVVLKAVGPSFLHKTDKDGVVIGLKDEASLQKAATSLLKSQTKLFLNQENYLVVQPQAMGKLELIVGIKRDLSFGPVLLLGLGGIYAEVFKQAKLAIADLDQARALNLIKELPFFSILDGARGKKKYDLNGLAKILVALSQLANDYPEIKELDINPLIMTDTKPLAVDVRIVYVSK